MKLFVLMLIPMVVFSLELIDKEGTVIEGELICESKGKLTIRSGNEAISFFKKSLQEVNSEVVSGKRDFMLGEDYLLREKNDIIVYLNSSDSARIKIREILADGTERLVADSTAVSGDTLVLAVPDGLFYETVEYSRGGVKYYIKGASFPIESKCDTFLRREIVLEGYPGDKPPFLKSAERHFYREELTK